MIQSSILLILFYILLIVAFAFIIKHIPKTDKRFLVGLVLLAILIRIIVMLILNVYLFDNGLYLIDSQSYHRDGIAYASALRTDSILALWPPHGQGYPFFVGIAYAVFGKFASIPEVLNISLSALTIILIFYITSQLSNKNAAQIAALLTAVYPSFIFASTQLLKDTLIIFLTTALIYIILNKDRLRIYSIPLIGVLLFSLTLFRTYIAVLLGNILMVYFLLIAEIKARYPIITRICIIILVLLIFQIAGFGFFGESLLNEQRKFAHIFRGETVIAEPELGINEIISDLNIGRQNMIGANSAFYANYHFDTLSKLIKYFPIGFAYYNFSPFPLAMNTIKEIMLLPEIILLYLAWPFIIIGLAYSVKNNFRKTSPILLFILLLTCFYSIINSNVGTIIRWRMQTYVFLFIFAGIGISISMAAFRKFWNDECPEISNKSSLALYISYDGGLEPLVQSQVIPYLAELNKTRRSFILLTFDKEYPSPASLNQIRSELIKKGIYWVPLQYHNHPNLLAKAYDIAAGLLISWQLVHKYNIRIIHARSYIAAAIAVLVKTLQNTKFIFDIRGVLPDERVDAGNWNKNSIKYWLSKRIEHMLFRAADEIVVLSRIGQQLLQMSLKESNISYIPTCVDLARFQADDEIRQALRKRLNLKNRFVLVYSGSLGSCYCLDEMIQFFTEFKKYKKEAYLLVLTKTDNSEIQKHIAERLSSQDYSILHIPYFQMPDYLSAADAGIFFIKPCYSKQFSCPTKLAEYLSCKLPVIINSGIGDADQIVLENNAGVVIAKFNTEEYKKNILKFIKLIKDRNLKKRCRLTAERNYSLICGAGRYMQIYRGLE